MQTNEIYLVLKCLIQTICLQSMRACKCYLLLSHTRLDLTQGLFCSGVFRKGGGQAQVSACALLDYAGHRLTRCNVRLMILLGFGLTKCYVSPACMSAHSLK